MNQSNLKIIEYILENKEEFSRTTINEHQKDLIINLRGRVPMNIECINSGIELGQTIIQNNSNNIKQKLLLNK